MTVVTKHSKRLFEAENVSGFIKRAIGLMGRGKLRKNGAMLFSFPFEHRWSFWMFGMRFPIDIVFLGKQWKVVYIERSARPLSFDPKTWKIVKPRKKFTYALEINAGSASRKRIKVGDVLSFYE